MIWTVHDIVLKVYRNNMHIAVQNYYYSLITSNLFKRYTSQFSSTHCILMLSSLFYVFLEPRFLAYAVIDIYNHVKKQNRYAL